MAKSKQKRRWQPFVVGVLWLLGWVVPSLPDWLNYYNIPEKKFTSFLVDNAPTIAYALLAVGGLILVLYAGPWTLQASNRLLTRVRARVLRRLARPVAWLPGSRDISIVPYPGDTRWRDLYWPSSAQFQEFRRVEVILMPIPPAAEGYTRMCAGIEITATGGGRIVLYVGNDCVRLFEAGPNPMEFPLNTPMCNWHYLCLDKHDDHYTATVNGETIATRPLVAEHQLSGEMMELWPASARAWIRCNVDAETAQVAVIKYELR